MALLLLLLSAATLSVGNAHQATFQCSRYCKEDWNKFGYESGSSYKYNYDGVIKTMINSSTDDKANAQNKFVFSTQVQIHVLSTCNYVMQLSDVNMREVYVNKEVTTTTIPNNSKALQSALTKNLLYFSFQNGRIETLCAEEDDKEVLHIKKGILSAFQNSMPNLEGDAVVYETDVSGNCETHYYIENSDSNMIITKTKNLEACSHRKSRQMLWLSVPHSKNLGKNSLLRSKQACKQRFNEDLILTSTQCSEHHLLQPFSNGDSGAVVYLTQNLEFLSKDKTARAPKLPSTFYYEDLFSNYNPKEHNKSNTIMSVTKLLELLESKTTDGVESDVPRIFSQFVHELQNLDYGSMIDVFQSVKHSTKRKKFILDAMPLTTNFDGIKAMKTLYQKGELSESQTASWLGSLIYFSNVSLPVIESITSLMEVENQFIKQKATLSVSTLVHMYCKQDIRCFNKPDIQRVIRIIEEPITTTCIPSSPNHYNDILLSLKGIGNIGLINSLAYLKNCYSNTDSSIELRLAAIAAHRRVSCRENDNLEQLENYFANPRENTEIRIASYLAVMQCASYATIARVKDVLRTEKTNQVGSFVWTHLTNMQESSSRWKRHLKSLVENEFLRNKFSTDMRKYSRNYEVSTYFDSLNTGVAVESNVVFTSESYLPKSAMLNFTLDLFGETVNVFEIGTRMEGFEQVIENLFGPEGYFPEESIKNLLENARNNDSSSQDKIQQIRNSFASQTTFKEPKGVLYAKIFGNEISYTQFKDFEGLIGNPINGRSILDSLLKLFRQQDVDFMKSFVFLDSSYKIPTVLGFPLELTINGTATVGLTVKSKIDLKDLWAHKISIEGKLYPSVAVEVIGTMTVDTLVGKFGLQSVNNLNSNTYLDGHAFINKGKLVDVKLNVPKQLMNIINVESQVSLIQSNRIYELDDVADNVEDWQGCTQKLFNTVTGLEVCYTTRYVNASQSARAPYFPLTGRFKYSLDIKKTDTFDSYQLSLKTYTQMKKFRPIYAMSFYLDTPNSTIDRKIETAYLLDCEKLSFNATLTSPFVKLEVNSKIGDDFDNLGFLLQTKLNSNEILLAQMSLKSVKINNTWKYEPLAELNYKGNRVAALSGNVSYVQGVKYSASLKLDWMLYEPLLMSGDLYLGSENFNLTSSILSNNLIGHVQAVVAKTSELFSVSAKITYDYKDYKNQVFDFDLKRHTLIRETATEEVLYVSANFTQKPLYNTLISFNMKRGALYFETQVMALILGMKWETHQLLKFFKSSENTDIALKCMLKCFQRNIDYNIDLSHINSNDKFKIHGLLQLNRTQRLEMLVNYKNIFEKNQTMELLLYYPKQAWMVNGVIKQQSQKEFNVFIESFYEINEEKRCMLVLSGEYINSSVARFQNHSVKGIIEIPESSGRFNTPWSISSTLQISKDMFLNTNKLNTNNDLYVSHITWLQNSFSTLLQINDKQLLVVNGFQSANELSMAFELNIYQHFDISVKLLMPYQKFQFILYWDKDNDIDQKISLTIDRHATKGLYLVDMEYPNQKVVASFILLPTQVTLNVTWGVDSSQRIFLEAGNKVYDIGGIWFAKLETPFSYLEYQEFKMSYYILPQNAELKVDMLWRDQKINLVISGIKSSHHLSGYLVVNTTIPEIARLNVAVSHSRNSTDGLLKIKNDAAFTLNDYQITGQCLWESRGTNISSSFKLVSPSNTIAPIMGMLIVSNNQSANHFSSSVIWQDKKVSLDYKFENCQSYIKIKTPFKGLEETELDYTLIGEPDRLILEIKANVLTQYNYALVSWNNEGHASVIKLEITCPIFGTYKIMFKHSTVYGHLEEYLAVTQGRNDILAVKLHGNLIPILSMNVTATIDFLEHKSLVAIKNTPNPIKSTFEAKWDDSYIASVLKVSLRDKEISELRWDFSSSFLTEDISCRYIQDINTYIIAVNLPKGYRFSNVFNFEDSYRLINNVLNVDTPSRSGLLRYSHNLASSNHSFDHVIIFKINNNESKLTLNYNINKKIKLIDAASIRFITPWKYPVAMEFSMHQENDKTWKPTFYLEYGTKTMINIKSIITVEDLSSNVHASVDLPYTIPFEINAKYDFSKPVNTIDVSLTEEGVDLKLVCDFHLEAFYGLLNLNITGEIMQEKKNFFVGSSIYDFRDAAKRISFTLLLPEQNNTLQFTSTTSVEEGVCNGNILMLSTVPEWEKVYLDLSVGLIQNASYIIFGKNEKTATIIYIYEKSVENQLISSTGKINLVSHFDSLKNCSLELKYKGSDKFQDATLKLLVGKHNFSFQGRYSFNTQPSKAVHIITLDGILAVAYHQKEAKNVVEYLNIDAKINASIEARKSSGKALVLFNSNIPNLKIVDVKTNYEFFKRGYEFKAATKYNEDYFRVENYFQPQPKKLEFSVHVHTPHHLYGNIMSKLSLQRRSQFVATELVFDKNSKLYNISALTRYDSLFCSDTTINIITPEKKYNAVLSSNFTLLGSNIRLYVTSDNFTNQVEFSIKTKNYKKAELHMHVDLSTVNFSPWALSGKYDFSSKSSFSLEMHNNLGDKLQATFDEKMLHVNVDTSTREQFLIISGNHKLYDINDLFISYSIYNNDHKIKVDLKHSLQNGRATSLEVTTTLKGWNRIAAYNYLNGDQFRALFDYNGRSMLINAHKNALFNNKELLTIELDNAPIMKIWSGSEKSFLTFLTPWGNYKLLVTYVSNTKTYTVAILCEGKKMVSLIIENLHVSEFLEFHAKLTNSLLPEYSDLTAYLYTNYHIPNKFQFNLNKEAKPIFGFSYNFELQNESYLAAFKLISQIEALQSFSVAFMLDPRFSLQFEVSKTQNHIEELYKLIIDLPFDSNECQLELGFPWQHEFASFFLRLKPGQVEFSLKSPFKEWKEAVLDARYKKIDNLIISSLNLKRNSAFVTAEWSYGYENQNPFVRIDVKNKLSEHNAETSSFVVNGKYVPGKHAMFICKAEEFENKINMNYHINSSGIVLETQVFVPSFITKELNLNTTIEYFSRGMVILEINNERILNITSKQNFLMRELWFGTIHIDALDNLYYYDIDLTYDLKYNLATVSLHSKTNNYLLYLKSEGQVDFNFLKGNISIVVEKGWVYDMVVSNNYEMAWLIRFTEKEKIAKIILQHNDALTSIDLLYFFSSDKSKSRITVACGSKALDMTFEGQLNSENVTAMFTLTTPLKQLSNLQVYTSVARHDNILVFHNFLSWPDKQNLTLNLQTSHANIEFLFTSPYNEPLRANLSYGYNSRQITFTYSCSMANNEITFNGLVIPSLYLTAQLTSPFSGYKHLNLTYLIDKTFKKAKVYFERESDVIELDGSIKAGENGVYEIDFITNNQYSNFAKMVLHVDVNDMKGKIQVQWKNKIVKGELNYNPNNLLLEVKSSFEIVSEILLQGAYDKTSKGYDLKAYGTWNEININFEGSLAVKQTFSVFTQAVIGQNYKAMLNLLETQDQVKLESFFTDGTSKIELQFLTKNSAGNVESHFLLSTPFIIVSRLSSDILFRKGHFDYQFLAELSRQRLESKFKTMFKNPLQFDSSFILLVPHISSKWGADVSLNLYKRGIFKIDYAVQDEHNCLNFNYTVIDSKIKSSYSMNGTKGNLNHTLELHFKNHKNSKEYGFALNDYKIIYKDTTKWYQTMAMIQVTIPCFNIRSETLFSLNALQKIALVKSNLNDYSVHIDVRNKYPTINASTILDLKNYGLIYIYTEVEGVKNGFLFKNNVSDSNKVWFNTTISYLNDDQGVSLHYSMQPFVANIYAAKTLDKILINIMNIFNLNVTNTPPSSQLMLSFENNGNHNLKIDFDNSNFSLTIDSNLVDPNHVKLTVDWFTKNDSKIIHFYYLEMDQSVIRGNLNFSYIKRPSNDKKYILAANIYNVDRKLLGFSGKFFITNVTQGSAKLDILDKRSHAYFIFNPNDPYTVGITIGSPFLPYSGITLETGVSVSTSSVFVFAGSGPSDLLERGFIHLESHLKYILFEARRQNKTAFIKYEAPAVSWLQLVELQVEFDIKNNKFMFSENFKLVSETLDNITLATKLYVLDGCLETNLNYMLPFITALEKFKGELVIPFYFSNDFDARILFELPTASYSVHATYIRNPNNFLVSGGYEWVTTKLNAHLQLSNSVLPIILVVLDVPFGNYRHFEVSLKRPISFTSGQETVCYIDVYNTRVDLKYTIIYKGDRHFFKTILTTNLESYNKFSLEVEHKNNQEKVLKVLIFLPKLTQESGFDFRITYHNLKNFKLQTKLSLPVEISGFNCGELLFFHNLKSENKTYTLNLFSRVNNLNTSVDLETALNSDLLLFNFDTKIGKNKFSTIFKYTGNVFDSLDLIFELETPLTIIKNAKLFALYSVKLDEGIRAGLEYNSKSYMELDFKIAYKELYLKFSNAWKPLFVEYQYSHINHLQIVGKFCWDTNRFEVSQFGGHLFLGKNISLVLLLPTRVIMVNADYFSNNHDEYYFGRVSWYKEKEISIKLLFSNYTSNGIVRLKSHASVTLPFRIFEIIDEVDANFQRSPTVRSKFTFIWDKKEDARMILHNVVFPGKLESRLFLPILKNEIVLKLDTTSLSNIPSYMQAQLEYSSDPEKRVEFEMYYNQILSEEFQTERKFTLRHPASKINYCLHFSTTRLPEYTTGNISIQYTNYLLNREEYIKSSLKIDHEMFGVTGEIVTSKYYLSVSGATKSGTNFQGFTTIVQLNKKDPLVLEGVYYFKSTGSSLQLTSRYGEDKRYDFFAGLPSKREMTMKLLHTLYDVETTDGLLTLRLNSSNILWIKLNWKDKLLPEFKNAILEEYNEVRYVIEGTGQQLIEIIDDDFGQGLFGDILELQNKISSYAAQEINAVSKDYNSFVNDVKEGYRSNAFYYQDIERTTKQLFPNFEILKPILFDPFLEFLELLYNGIFYAINDTIASLQNICSIVRVHLNYSMREVKDIKHLKIKAKEILKHSIKEARESLRQMDVLFVNLMNSMDQYVNSIKNQCEEYFEPYLKLLDDFVIYVEQRLAILQMLVLDILETIQHYILNLRESREVLKVYALYINWLEEFHITDVLEPIADIIEAILETIITDVKKVMNGYKPYINAISEAIFGNYQELNNLPPLTEFREILNKLYQRTLWIWNYHNLSEAVKTCVHKIIADFDDYLASLIKLDNNNNDFENVLGQSDYIFRPDMGIIEITQPLPVEWEAFDEMPYFEQHPMYHKIKKRVENLIQIQKHHFNDFFSIIKSYIKESPKNLLSPPTNNIGMIVGKSHYITFDKKYYSFSGKCSYLLAGDFVSNSFSVVINYSVENSTTKRKSISIITSQSNVEIFPDYSLKLNDMEVNAPLFVESLTITRRGYEIFAENSKGLKMICNFYHDFCSVELSGWLFGKTGGLLGTLDNEKDTDMSLPDGNRSSHIMEFVQSWQVENASKCDDFNHANDTSKTNLSPLTITLFETLCQVYFINANSPLGNCFTTVDPMPFYDICVSNMMDTTNPTMCSSIAAYKAQCGRSNIYVDMPEMCVHCKYGVDLNENIFDRDNPKSIDVVIIKEHGCLVNQTVSILPKQIDNALIKKGFTDNQFAVIGYGGRISTPEIYTFEKNIWNSAKDFKTNVFIDDNKHKHKLSAIDAIRFASDLEFRPSVSKLFILIQCGYRLELDNLNSLHNMFGEKDITLHLLRDKPLNHHNEELLEWDGKGHVLYVQPGFNVLNSAIINTTVNELMPNQITEVYNLLALSTNGTILTIDKKITHSTKPILNYWAEVISQTAKRSPCQRCKCIIGSDGTGKVECTRCMSPVVKQLLNEYESNIMEFHSDQDSEEYV